MTTYQKGDDPEKHIMALIITVIMSFALLLLVGKCHSQEYFYSKLDSLQLNNKTEVLIMSGTCLSPDGPNKAVSSPPPNWQWLSDNGYCYTTAPLPAKNITMCFTLTSPGTDVDFNAGFSTTGCAGYSVNYAYLYTSAPGCVLVDGTALGTTTGLTVGANYTWCLSLSGTGPPSCKFTSLCPYYQDMTVLPVDLLTFYCVESQDLMLLKWVTASESNINYFCIEGSGDTRQWIDIQHVKAVGGNSLTSYSAVVQDFEYFRLSEVDFNGLVTILQVINCQNSHLNALESFWDVYSMDGKLIFRNVSERLISNLFTSWTSWSSDMYILKNDKKTKIIRK